jgi:mono/diheme cytochrome c family protein
MNWYMLDNLTPEEAGDTKYTEMKMQRGELMFRGQCMACHTTNGYRSMKKMLKGRDKEGISSMMAMLHEYKEDSPYRKFMPPLVGTKGEIEALITYLDSLINKTD